MIEPRRHYTIPILVFNLFNVLALRVINSVQYDRTYEYLVYQNLIGQY